MPTYDYACAACGRFEALRPMAQRDRDVDCPDCGKAAARVIAGGARLGVSGDERSGLIARQERALADGSYRRMRHPLSCGCCR